MKMGENSQHTQKLIQSPTSLSNVQLKENESIPEKDFSS